MPFSLGALELLLLSLIAISGALLYVRRHRYDRACLAALVLATLAALLTPPDVLSMVLAFVAFAGVFMFGSRYRIDRPDPTT